MLLHTSFADYICKQSKAYCTIVAYTQYYEQEINKVIKFDISNIDISLKYSQNQSTAIVFILCLAYLILSDDGAIIKQDFCAD